MMTQEKNGTENLERCAAFAGQQFLASGELRDVALAVKNYVDREPLATVLVFDNDTSETIELDLRGTPGDVLERLPVAIPQPVVGDGSQAVDREAQPGPGRPRLGVVAREVTLLPRHWEWLNSQPGGSSVALRKLVEEARRANAAKDRIRRAQESAYRFLSIMGGDLPGFEEASRALFAGSRPRFDETIQSWPVDIREHAKKLADGALDSPDTD